MVDTLTLTCGPAFGSPLKFVSGVHEALAIVTDSKACIAYDLLSPPVLFTPIYEMRVAGQRFFEGKHGVREFFPDALSLSASEHTIYEQAVKLFGSELLKHLEKNSTKAWRDRQRQLAHLKCIAHQMREDHRLCEAGEKLFCSIPTVLLGSNEYDSRARGA